MQILSPTSLIPFSTTEALLPYQCAFNERLGLSIEVYIQFISAPAAQQKIATSDKNSIDSIYILLY